jgi:hypothetical protein
MAKILLTVMTNGLIDRLNSMIKSLIIELPRV